MYTLYSKINQLVIFVIYALSIFLMTAAYANASNIFISDTVTADETNENKTIAVWLDSSPASGNVTVTYTITEIADGNGTIGSKDSVTVSIDDDDYPTITLDEISDSSFTEKNGELIISASIPSI